MLHPGSLIHEQVHLLQSGPQSGCQLNALLGGVGHFPARVQCVIGVARKYMEMVVPHILIAGWSIVLASGDSFTTKGTLHSMSYATRGTKEVVAEVVRYVQHVLIVAPRHHQTVALNSTVVVSRNQGEHVRIH